MAKLFVIMGKSSTGKDTVYKELLKKWKSETYCDVYHPSYAGR